MVEPTPDMNIRYQLSEPELIEAFMARAGRASAYLRVFGCLLIAAGIFQFLSPEGNPYMGSGAIAGGALWLFYMSYSARIWVRDEPRMQEAFQADISEHGLKIEGSSASTDYTWNAFKGFRETKNLFLLYQSSTVINPIPKRAFATDEQQKFRELATAKVPAQLAKPRFHVLRVLFFVAAVVAIVLLYYGRHFVR